MLKIIKVSILVGVAALILAGILIARLESSPPVLLVRANDWRIEDGFAPALPEAHLAFVSPPSGDIPVSIARDRDTRFWTSRTSPERKPKMARIETVPFRSESDYIGIPLNGSPMHLKISVFLENVSSGDRVYFKYGDTKGHWSKVIVKLDPAWRKDLIKLVAIDESGDGSAAGKSNLPYIEIGSPFTEHWSRSFPALPSLALSVFLCTGLLWLLVAPFYYLVGLLGVRKIAIKYLLTLVGVSMGSFPLFFLFFFVREIAIGAVLVWLLGGIASTVFLLIKIKKESFKRIRNAHLAVALFLIVGFSSVSLLYSQRPVSMEYLANYRFSPAYWSTDNHLPVWTAWHLVKGDLMEFAGTGQGAFGQWKVSDRPPLFGAMLCPLFVLMSPGKFFDLNPQWTFLLATTFGVLVMSAWVFPVWALLRRARCPGRVSVSVILLLAFAPFVFFNTVYIWPKLLAATLAMICYFFLSEAIRRKPARLGACVVAGVSGGLATMSHGGIFFGLLAIGLWWLYKNRTRNFAGTLLFGLAGIAVVLPWLIWSKQINPPGNALPKFAFTGDFGFADPNAGLMKAIFDKYSSTPAREWLQLKVIAVKTWLGLEHLYPNRLIYKDWGLGIFRAYSFFHLFPSLAILCVPLVGWVGRRFRKRRNPDVNHPLNGLCRAMMMLGILGVVLQFIFIWNVHIVHHYAYSTVLALHLAGVIALLFCARSVRIALATAHIVYFFAFWVIHPMVAFGNFNPGIVVVSMLGWLVMGGLAVWGVAGANVVKKVAPAHQVGKDGQY